jgi:hypothetical protein
MRFANELKSMHRIGTFLSADEMARVLEIDPNFLSNEFAPDGNRVNDYCAFYLENQRQPDRRSADITERLLDD